MLTSRMKERKEASIMDIQQQKSLDKVQSWFGNADTWQKDLFCKLWDNALKEDQLVKRSSAFVGQEFLGISCNDTPMTNFPSDFSFQDNNKAPVTLKEISDITGVGALAPTARLTFGRNLTIIYGENGCGKSSYVRILKALENYANEDRILGNVFESKPASAKATIVFSSDGKEDTIAWEKGNKKKYPLQIYDTAVAQQFVDKENEVIYEPRELSVITRMAQIYEQVAQVYKEKSQLEAQRAIPLGNIAVDGSVLKEYEALSTIESVQRFVKKHKWGANAEKELAAVIDSLKESDPQKKAEMLSRRKCIIEAYYNKAIPMLSLVEESACEEYLEKRKRQIETRRQQDALIDASKEQSLLDKFGSIEWRNMWSKAQKYVEIVEDCPHEIPVTNSGRCALCQQELDTAAKFRMEKFNEFLRDDLSKQAETASKVFSQAVQSVQDCVNGTKLRQIEESLISSSIPEEMQKGIYDLYRSILARCEWLLNYEEVNTIPRPCIKTKDEAKQMFKNYIAEIEMQIKAYEAAGKNQKAQIERRNYLQTVQWATMNIPIKEKLIRLKRIEKSCKTNTLTTLKKDLSRLLITDAYIEKFRQELHELDDRDQIHVELVEAASKRGKSYHQIALRGAKSIGNHKNGEILSEGEYRVVSLAAFLADLSAWRRTMPFIFDDPITSLDHNFEAKVAARLVKLSMDRQVIIFTHRLAFVKLLDTEVANYRTDEEIKEGKFGGVEYIQLEKKPLGSQGDLRFLRDVSITTATKKMIAEDIPRIQKMQKEGNYIIANQLLQALCSNFRTAIEQGISQDLLAGIVIRYDRNISSLKLPQLYAMQEADIRLVHDMMSKYSCYEHSQSIETPASLPSIEDVIADIHKMEAWGKDYKKRRDAAAQKERDRKSTFGGKN